MKKFSHRLPYIIATYIGLSFCIVPWGASVLQANLLQQFSFGTSAAAKAAFFTIADFDFTQSLSPDSAYEQALSKQYYTFLHGSAVDEYSYAKKTGIYFTANSVNRQQFFAASLDALQAAGGNAIVIDVKGTNIYFDAPGALMAQDMNRVQPLYNLTDIVAEAHKRGIYVIARYIAVKDPSLATAYPETQVRHPQTGRSIGTLWVDPAHELTLAYNAEILREVATTGIDEINLDYIRYGTEVPNYAVGLTGEQKADHLVEFLQMARKVVDTYGLNTKLGISTYAILGWNFAINFESVGQDIQRFAQYVDVISPMAYPSTFAAGAYFNPSIHPKSRNYYLVYRTLQGYKKLLQPNDVSKLRPWIQGYGLLPQGIAHEIQAVYDTGLCGYTVWNAGNVYSRTFTAMNAVEVPLHCR